jgi:SAM-dependent methyltransferase
MKPVDPKAVLGHLSGGRVLDVATGTGGFVQFLLDGLRDYAEIVGIDAVGERAAAFSAALGDRADVRFEQMDAHHLVFPDGSFDTVSISNSLHHVADPAPVLAEMLRVLRPGGHLVVNEMYRDGQSETQTTHVLLHHWWAAVNRLRGEVHRETRTAATRSSRSSGASGFPSCAFSTSPTQTRIPMTRGPRPTWRRPSTATSPWPRGTRSSRRAARPCGRGSGRSASGARPSSWR